MRVTRAGQRFLGHWVKAFGLCALTYNPTEGNFFYWMANTPDVPASGVMLATIIIVTGFTYYVRGAFAGIGQMGTTTLFVFLWVLAWFLADTGVVLVLGFSHWVWWGLVVTSLTLAFGVSWPHLRSSGFFYSPAPAPAQATVATVPSRSGPPPMAPEERSYFESLGDPRILRIAEQNPDWRRIWLDEKLCLARSKQMAGKTEYWHEVEERRLKMRMAETAAKFARASAKRSV